MSDKKPVLVTISAEGRTREELEMIEYWLEAAHDMSIELSVTRVDYEKHAR